MTRVGAGRTVAGRRHPETTGSPLLIDLTDGPPATRVAVQHRRRLFRESMALVLEREADLFVVATPSTGPELVKVAEEDHLDLVVLELDVTDWDPCWLVPALRRHHRHLAVVGTRPGVESCPPERAHQAGVQTVFPHGAGVAAFMGAVRTVLSRAPMPATARVVALEAPAPPLLTSRELEVLTEIGMGATSQQVAVRLGVTPKTVENYKQRIFQKLEVQNQTHAVAVAIRRGLLTPEADVRLGVLTR